MRTIVRNTTFARSLGVAFAVWACNDETLTPKAHDAPDGGELDAGSPAPPGPVRFTVGGVADGLGGSLLLGMGDEKLSLDQSGPFAFQTRLRDGEAYSVEVLEQPTEEYCWVEMGQGAIDGADVTDVVVICDPGNPGLEGLAFSVGELSPAWSPTEQRYRVDVPLWIEALNITPQLFDTDVQVQVGNTSFAGDPVPVELAIGQNSVEISAKAENGEPRVYVVDIYRASRVVQEASGKTRVPQESAQFGVALSLDGDTLAVGAPGQSSDALGVNGDEDNSDRLYSGAVYIFSRTQRGWEQTAFLKASNAGADDLFGMSVALAGDTLVVGAPEEGSDSGGINGNGDNDRAPGSGASYVFQRTGGTWEQVAYLKAHAPYHSDNFGHSVAIARDGEFASQRIVVGAYHDANSATGADSEVRDEVATASGAAYIFEVRSGGWEQTAYLKPSNTDPGDSFGESVTLSGDTVVVGAPWEDGGSSGTNGDAEDDSAEFAGAAYVFARDSSSDRWAQTAYLKASNAREQSHFGHSVSLDGPTLAVGAFAEQSSATGIDGDQTDASAVESGAVYIFDLSTDGDWQQSAFLKASNSDPNDRFGWAVALHGEALVVGAPFEHNSLVGIEPAQNDNDSPGAGAAYVFHRRDGTWTQQVYVKASNAEAGDNLGTALGFDGISLVAGAPYEDSAEGGVTEAGGPNNVMFSAGSVYWFR